MKIHGQKLRGESGRKIQIFPMNASTPPSLGPRKLFNPDGSNRAKKTLDLAMGQVEGEVSPQTAAISNLNPDPNLLSLITLNSQMIGIAGSLTTSGVMITYLNTCVIFGLGPTIMNYALLLLWQTASH